MKTSKAIQIWREKLEFLRSEEAKASDSMQKFTLSQGIAEAKAKITELTKETEGLIDAEDGADIAPDEASPAVRAATTTESSFPIARTTPRARYAVVLSGEIPDDKKEFIEALYEHLKRVADDTQLTLVEIRQGSVRLIMEGTEDGFESIHSLFRSGQLRDLSGRRVELVRKLRLVILLHGIRTQAEWQENFRPVLRADGGITEVIAIKYGYFDTLSFLLPFPRRRILDTIHRKLMEALLYHRGEEREVVVIAHSFGTYAIARILREHPEVSIDRLVLLGSIVPRDYPWLQLPNLPKQIINEAGSRDILPVLAKSLSWGYGASGTFGFGSAGVVDRVHNLRHSDYFTSDFVEKYIKSLVHDSEFIEPPFAEQKMSWFISVLEVVPLKWLLPPILAGLGAGLIGPRRIWELLGSGRIWELLQ